MLGQDACAFYNVSHPGLQFISLSNTSDKGVALYTQVTGVVLAEDEGKHIASALGNKKVLPQLHTCVFVQF